MERRATNRQGLSNMSVRIRLEPTGKGALITTSSASGKVLDMLYVRGTVEEAQVLADSLPGAGSDPTEGLV
jgi:hypothetical protein